MTNHRVTVTLSGAEIAALAKNHLGMVPAGSLIDAATIQAALRERSQAVDAAIELVIRATRKFDQAQFSNGEAGAATALFEAGKRLRAAVSEEKKSRDLKGIFNV